MGKVTNKIVGSAGTYTITIDDEIFVVMNCYDEKVGRGILWGTTGIEWHMASVPSEDWDSINEWLLQQQEKLDAESRIANVEVCCEDNDVSPIRWEQRWRIDNITLSKVPYGDTPSLWLMATKDQKEEVNLVNCKMYISTVGSRYKVHQPPSWRMHETPEYNGWYTTIEKAQEAAEWLWSREHFAKGDVLATIRQVGTALGEVHLKFGNFMTRISDMENAIRVLTRQGNKDADQEQEQ